MRISLFVRWLVRAKNMTDREVRRLDKLISAADPTNRLSRNNSQLAISPSRVRDQSFKLIASVRFC